MITKEQLEAIIKAVDEGGDGDDEISEEEVIAILRDYAPGEIHSFRKCLPGSGLEIAHTELATQPLARARAHMAAALVTTRRFLPPRSVAPRGTPFFWSELALICLN